MTWQLLLLISILADVGGRLIQRTLLRDTKSDPITYAIAFQLLAGCIVGFFAFFNGFKIPSLQPILPNLLLMPLFYGLANIFIFKSLKLAEASVFTVLFSSRAVWIILSAMLLLQETFSLYQFLGTILILFSILLVSWQGKLIRLRKGEMYGLLAAFIFACGIVNDAFIVKSFDPASYMTIAFLLPGLFILALYPKKLKTVATLRSKDTIVKMLVLSVAYGLSAVTYVSAYRVGNNAAQIGAIAQVSTILTVLCAIVLLQEKSSVPKKILAGVISVIGVILVTV